ncbi:hypothetical protein BDQ94DRAFT_164706 [Aspergillus welwitschiae]|uniref:Uncharacterized protein n=1 Tax=Aspergillus welwitschiae TaxID=1341132 RepID=A0A3F3PHF6_9EURO|nr:hypothetical protein BDQ94DRAFT_164706 [Aspergillus welwitschiae]RDH26173.1 hypothetical protein BDQ94DRAFT_164706 [Aspergillus welwitschiae]
MAHICATCDSPLGGVAEEPCNRPEAQVACGYMGSEGLLAGFYPKTPPNSPRTVPLEPVLTEHMSKNESIPTKHIPAKVHPFVEARWENERKESRRAPAHRNS